MNHTYLRAPANSQSTDQIRSIIEHARRGTSIGSSGSGSGSYSKAGAASDAASGARDMDSSDDTITRIIDTAIVEQFDKRDGSSEVGGKQLVLWH